MHCNSLAVPILIVGPRGITSVSDALVYIYVGPTYGVGGLHYAFPRVLSFLPSFFFLSFFLLLLSATFCPAHYSETTGPFQTIRTVPESSCTIDVHWLCHFPKFIFQLARMCPNVPDRADSLSGPLLGNHWAVSDDSNCS